MKIKKVLITGGREIGGVTSFANNLQEGFQNIGIPAMVVSPFHLLRQWRELRDPHVLKILSTSAVFMSPFCCCSICVAHGFPRRDAQGLIKSLGIRLSLRMAEHYSLLIAVSHYVRIHLKTVFDINCCGVIHNAVSQTYLDLCNSKAERKYITYVGRLTAIKNIEKLIEPIRRVLDRHAGMECVLIGQGEEQHQLQKAIDGDVRFSLLGSMGADSIRSYLQRTSVFLSGCETEALGISYLEALSQGCNVVMPACGGGIEINVGTIGKKIFLLPLDFDISGCAAIIDTALNGDVGAYMDITEFFPDLVAHRYLNALRLFPLDKISSTSVSRELLISKSDSRDG
jgi:glycosyltransferase involved in cell wall biosynthesis